jgi:isoleucyl-tRNA synthetase
MLALDRWAVDRATQLQQEICDAYADYQFHLIYQKVHNFCVSDLGGFYLDVTKDRQYTCRADSIARRSCQTAMLHIAEALVRWLAPILSFTADEIWQHLPGERDESVFLSTWYEGLFPLDEDADLNREDWSRLLSVRAEIGRRLEHARKAGAVGGSLDAEVDLYCEPPFHDSLAKLGDELRFLFITSDARLNAAESAVADAVGTDVPGLRLAITPSARAKCVRCWHHRADVGSDSRHPELCGRCVENVEGAGETRRFA